MNYEEIKSALQDLIIRLQDAEKGYMEISKASGNMELKNWLNNYAIERHQMHKELENHVSELGGDAEVKTSFLGDLHRMFIDLKINNIDTDKEFDSVVTEINRGSSVLINDYSKVLSDIKFPASIAQTLIKQKVIIEGEIESINELNEKLNSVAI